MNAGNGKTNGNGHDPGEEPPEDNVVRMPSLAERDKMRREQEKQWRREYRAKNRAEPLLNLPPVTKIMLFVMLAVHIGLLLFLDDPQRYWVYFNFGFVSADYTVAFPGWPAFIGPFTYMLIHGNWLHIAMNGTMLLAFGSGVEKWLGGRRMLILFTLCSLAAAAFHFALSPFSDDPIIGASGGLSGLFAAVLIMLQQQGRLGAGRYGIWPFAAFWIGISIVFGMLGAPDGSLIAWAAHIGGFLAGLVLVKPVLRM